MGESINTTKVGNAFRDEIMHLIKLRPGCREVQAERLIGTQPVDLYYQEQTSSGVLKIACECKAYAKPLTKAYIAEKIVPRYLPLVTGRMIDRVRIIAPLPLGATADAYVRELGSFSFVTKYDLEAEMIDFSSYVQSIKGQFFEKGLNRYYIPPRLADGNDLELRIVEWIRGSSSQPIAILAGYGMGKTSFARRLAYIAAETFQDDHTARIPILIPLSEIASEQRIDGLLGRLLTSDYVVPNYSWGLFSALHARGRFLIILDGFDEMKHTMSWNDFKHNFVQLNKLVVPNARVLLLGRPSAFMSDLEHTYILSGQRTHNNHIVRVADAPTYDELHLLEFSLDQAMEFIKKYADYQGPVSALLRGEKYDQDMVNERLKGVVADGELRGLATRPVQAQMVADLAIDPGVKWRSFTRYELYSEFIHRIIEREIDKPTRAMFTFDERLTFHRTLAWFLWNRTQGTAFRLADIPSKFVSAFRKEDISHEDDESIMRDLISGSLLERKIGDAYFFPHRSFIEFLVADYFTTLEPDRETLYLASSYLTDEIADFIKESGRPEAIAEWFRVMRDATGALSFRMLALISWSLNKTHEPIRDPVSDSTPHEILVAHLQLLAAGRSHSEIVNFLGHAFYAVGNDSAKLSCIRGLGIVANAADPALKVVIWDQITVFILLSCLEEFKRVLSQHRHGPAGMQLFTPLVKAFAESCRSESDTNGDPGIRIETEVFWHWINHALGQRWQVSDIDLGHEPNPQIISIKRLGARNERLRVSAEGAIVVQFLKTFPNPRELIGIQRVTRDRDVRRW